MITIWVVAEVLDISVESNAGYVARKRLTGNFLDAGMSKRATRLLDLKMKSSVSFLVSLFYLAFDGRFQQPGDTAASILTFVNETSSFAFLLLFNLALSCIVWQSKKSI